MFVTKLTPLREGCELLVVFFYVLCSFRCSEDNFHVTGCIFVFPVEVEHLPTRVFLPREVFLTGNDRATFPITAAQGKCFVMRPADFFIGTSSEFHSDCFCPLSPHTADAWNVSWGVKLALWLLYSSSECQNACVVM